MTNEIDDIIKNHKLFMNEIIKYMKQHDQRLLRIEQYNFQLAAIFNQAAECLEDE